MGRGAGDVGRPNLGLGAKGMDGVSLVGLRLALPGPLLATGVPDGPSGLRMSWATLDRAARLAARLGAAPIRRRRRSVPEEAFDKVGGTPDRARHDARARAPGKTAAEVGFLPSAQGLTPGAAIAPVGRMAERSAAVQAGSDGEANDSLPRSGLRHGESAARGRIGRAAARGQAQQVEAQATAQAGTGVDPARFGSLGAPPERVTRAIVAGMATGTGTARAAAALPAWMTGARATAAKPTWMGPEWVGGAAGLTALVGAKARNDAAGWLMPAQGVPAAPLGAHLAPNTGHAWPSPFEQGRGWPAPPLLGTRGAEAWFGDAGPASAASLGNGIAGSAGRAGFGSDEGMSRQMMDQMARLASRPPVGITGFDAAQMPAWLSGWTGGM